VAVNHRFVSPLGYPIDAFRDRDVQGVGQWIGDYGRRGSIPYVVIRGMLAIPIAASIPLFMIGVVIYLFFATAIGIFLGTVARSMPQLRLLYMLVYLPINVLSGSNTPLESMPPWLATVMQASPPTHFVLFAQSILYRGAGLDVVWPQFLAVAVVGGLFFGFAILRFRSVAAQSS
jgi:ABC-2 type transport system permease protein